LNLGDVVHAQPERRRILNVAGLADEAIDAGIIVVAFARLYVIHGAVPDGDGVLGLALIVDHIDQQAVNRHRIGPQHHLLGIKTKLAAGRKRPAVPHAAQSIHDVQHSTRPHGLDRGQRADERIRIALRPGM
jgi:hypothetical protein